MNKIHFLNENVLLGFAFPFSGFSYIVVFFLSFNSLKNDRADLAELNICDWIRNDFKEICFLK